MVLAAARGLVRGGAATRAAGAAGAAGAVDIACATMRALSGRREATDAPPAGAALSVTGADGVRCDAGTSGAGRGGGGAVGGAWSFTTGAAAGATGVCGAPDCAAAVFAAPRTNAKASILIGIMVSPS
jgi:hypothetical protein